MRSSQRAWLVLLLAASAASANQTSFRGVPLESVLTTSDVLVVQNGPEPRTRKITVEVATAKQPKAPPYVYVETRYLVDEVLKGDKALVGKELWVKPANWADGLELHKAYYLEGMGESPIYSRYTPRWKSAVGAKQRIVFVQKPKGAAAYQEAVQDGFEGIDGRAKIIELLGKRP